MTILEPLNFIDSITSKKHLLLVYDNIKKGRAIEFHFIRRGLEIRDRCIYLTHGDEKDVENSMKESGIDTDYFINENLLYIYKISNPVENSVSILDGVNKILTQVLEDPKTPFRIVGRLVPDVSIGEAMSVQVYLEKIFHNGIFDGMNGSVLCTYDYLQIQKNDKWDELLDVLQRYHHALILYKQGKSTVTINRDELA